tara:strand:- start:84 stop:320 length:237 start_codon:yes stop_codon:yes gene_type:complete
MFENLTTALLQAIGFFGVFIFFILKLLSDNNKGNKDFQKYPSQSKKNITSEKKIKKKRFFGKSAPTEEKSVIKKNRWF